MVRVRIRIRFGVRFRVRVRVRPFSRSREVRFWTRPRLFFTIKLFDTPITVYGAKVPGSEISGSELARERKGSLPNYTLAHLYLLFLY